MNLKKTSVMKLFCAVIFFASFVASISICCCDPLPIEIQKNIMRYDNALQLKNDLYDFIGIKKNETITEEKIKSLKNFVLLLDCDGVLQRNTDPALVGSKIWPFMKGVKTEHGRQITIWESPKSIVEQEIVDMIQLLKKYGILCLVVTQCSSDPESQHRRESILEKLGYSFKDNILENDKTFLEKLKQIQPNCQLELKPGQENITPPRFSNGIVYTGSATKEATFEWLLELIKSSGKFCDIADVKFAFIDDKFENNEEFCKVFHKKGVKKYRAYHYTNDQKQASTVPSTDKSIEEIQKIAIRKGTFIHYEDACFLDKMFQLIKLER